MTRRTSSGTVQTTNHFGIHTVILSQTAQNAEVGLQFDLGIVNGDVMLPQGKLRCNIFVIDGRIAAITQFELPAEKIIEAKGLVVIPGSVDPHVHMMDPGYSDREDFMTGTAASALGGVTTIVEHHRTKPFVTNATVLKEKAKYLSGRSIVDFALFGGAHPENKIELQPMWESGAVAFKAFTCNLHGAPALLAPEMLGIFRQLTRFDGLCLVHAEDESITANNERRLKTDGRKDFGSILEWRSKEAEQIAVRTVVHLCEITGARVVIAHASHPEIIDIIMAGKRNGAKIYSETCPQYMYLTEDDVRAKGPWSKFTPPARDAASAQEMWKRLESGQVDMVDADHAPTTKSEKQSGLRDIWEAPFGIPGIETKIPLLATGVNDGKLSLERLVLVTSTIPATIYGLYPKKGVVQVGSDADLVMVDLKREGRISNENVISKCGWTPYDGFVVRGLPVATILRGHVIMEDRTVTGRPGQGEFVPRDWKSSHQ